MNARAPKIAFSLALAIACSFVRAGDAASAAAAAANALTSEDEAAVIRKIQERGPRDVAIEKAVAFMISQQGKDGGFGDKHRNAITGLTVMALMAAGHTPDSPQHGPAIRNALNFVLSQMRNDGYMGHSDNSRMYGHGICTLMLTEAAGMTKDDTLEKRLVEACRRAVQLILKAQAIKKAGAHNGGWRYEPASLESFPAQWDPKLGIHVT